MSLSTTNAKIGEVLKKYPITGAYLYGSKISGKPNALSDLDIGILLADDVSPEKYFPLRLKIQDVLGKALKKEKVDLAILNQVSPLLAQNIVTKGRLIFCQNKDKIANFACQVLKKYDDALFLRETYYRHLATRVLKGKLGETKR